MKVAPIPVHHMSHIYQAYTDKLVKRNPGYFGKYFHNLYNYYVYQHVIDEETGKKTVVEIMNYPLFRKIVEQYFHRAKNAIIAGEALHVNCCGKLCAKRCERSFLNEKKRQVNWGKSNKFRRFSEEKSAASGKDAYTYDKLVYYTEDDFLRIGWWKPGIRNETMYEFEPASGNSGRTSGFKLEFSQANTNNPLLRYRYPYFPIKYVDNEQE